jgi:hypothetical protein
LPPPYPGDGRASTYAFEIIQVFDLGSFCQNPLESRDGSGVAEAAPTATEIIQLFGFVLRVQARPSK